MPTILLKPGREKSLLRRHPWIFSGAVELVDGNPTPGATVDILSAERQFLARAAFSPVSQIRARIWSFDPEESVGKDFFRKRLTQAVSSRLEGLSNPKGACRLVHAESDGLPGLVVDRYSDVLVVQFLSCGAEFWRETFTDLLVELTGIENIYERSDVEVRELEGLPLRTGNLRGQLPGYPMIISENDLQFKINIEIGHKTGFYLDQCLNRAKVRKLCKDRQVLDCFAYSGGFTVNALAGGAKSVLSVDTSTEALTLCKDNVTLNNLPADLHTTQEGDAFHLLRKFRDEGRSFDLIILDPPKFAPTTSQAERAARGYKDINLLGFKLLRPGGILVSFSCSGGVDAALFQKIVASAALDAGIEVQIVEHLEQGPDHPIAMHFPEGAYLKGLVCRRQTN